MPLFGGEFAKTGFGLLISKENIFHSYMISFNSENIKERNRLSIIIYCPWTFSTARSLLRYPYFLDKTVNSCFYLQVKT